MQRCYRRNRRIAVRATAAIAHFCVLVRLNLRVDAEKGQKALEIPHQNRNAAAWAGRMAQAGTLIAVAHMQAAALVLGFSSGAPQ